ncbi:MAG: LPS export ABC transporter permease LptF [Rhodobacteraceae bacterium]|nr:LPS export ABC transporter permease LptF [Paracoccaceae bacterium]
MGKFDRYMLSQLLVIFSFSSIVLVLVYWINRAVRLFDWLIASGQSATVFLEFTALTLPNVIRLVLPISAFAATVYVTNRLSSESELVTVQATGYSPGRLARPVVVFGLIVAAFVSALVHFAVPASLSRLAARQVEISENVTARLLVEGQFVHPADDLTLYIREITPQGELRDIFLRDTRSEEQDVIYTATRALIVNGPDGPRFVMRDGKAQTVQIETLNLAVTSFGEFAFDLSTLLGDFDLAQAGRLRISHLSTPDLLRPTPRLIAETRSSAADMRLEGHQRFTIALMSVAVPLIGFATLLLGGFSRFGIWNQIFGAIALIVLLQVADNAIIDLALARPELWGLIYTPGLVGLALGLLLLWLAANPQVYRRRRSEGSA